MTEPLDDTIRENAGGPKRAAGDSGSVEQHELREQIEADRYLEAKKAGKAKGLAIKFVRLLAPGTD